MQSIVYNEDCLAAMRQMKDNQFDLSLVDAPYGLGKRLSNGASSSKLAKTPMVQLYKKKDWDVLPPAEFWSELFRVSKNQIIFGANYFGEHLPSTRGIVCWDKLNKLHTLSEWELVWTSYDRVAKIFRQVSMDNERFHPTQKPIKLYKYMLQYARIKSGSVLDPFLGSGSSRIACHDFGLDFVGYELDSEYYAKQEQRYQDHILTPPMFEAEELLPLFDEELYEED